MDCVCLDMEDAVADSRKGAARDTIATALSSEWYSVELIAYCILPHGTDGCSHFASSVTVLPECLMLPG